MTQPILAPPMQDYFLRKAANTLRMDGHAVLATVVDLIRQQLPEPDRDDGHAVPHV